MPYIYKITNVINNKIYIGKTSHTTIEQRFKEHLNDAKTKNKGNRPLYKAINKYGAENFGIELIEEVATDEIACEREVYWINYYRTYVGFNPCNGYNATLGGDGKSYIDREKVKETLLKYPNKTSEQIADMCDCCSDMVREIAQQNNIHIKTSQEKIRETLKRTVQQIDLGTGKIINTFSAVQDACVYLKEKYKIEYKYNAMRAQIARCARGERKQAFGFGWEYV